MDLRESIPDVDVAALLDNGCYEIPPGFFDGLVAQFIEFDISKSLLGHFAQGPDLIGNSDRLISGRQG